jgi:hypothetical protein
MYTDRRGGSFADRPQALRIVSRASGPDWASLKPPGSPEESPGAPVGPLTRVSRVDGRGNLVGSPKPTRDANRWIRVIEQAGGVCQKMFAAMTAIMMITKPTRASARNHRMDSRYWSGGV